ncbi:phosphatidylinositol-binding protein scs2 [Purpureocillium takamizusanense]|uniref:Phosphatidylinositol-binding protein scs2 n=1 Tax=Purpureocillium takamizusanense TaxID=2060973 RepID=A0A9Q8QJE9_9HYPO|nr:phosphatidylinositol-binding protein scs2 [Purpureocillium takamizusanense]UNI20953.1 phosphatidylinositol-binding protein scs2 [Purpureocillium takamizusanense]
MSVDIEPFELSFRRPFTVEVSQTLTIKNPTSTPLAFKVKTTAPKQYCVRPNAGRIEPGQAFDVTVLLQAMKADPPLDTRCRDKFLVQSAPITPEKEFASIAAVLESTDKGQIQERKIRVNWLAPVGSQEPGANQPVLATPNKQSLLNGAHDTPEASRTFSSPKAEAPDSTPLHAPPPYPSDDAREDDEKSDRPKSAVSQAATAVSETAQATYEELKAKLAQAEAQLANLKDSGLRQRTVKTASGEKKLPDTGRVAQAVKQQPVGVPVQMVAILCLLSFLLAYFFF